MDLKAERAGGPKPEQGHSLDQHPVAGATPAQQKLDHVLDRQAGEDYNPVPDDIVKQNRARFEAANRRLREDLTEASELLATQAERLKAQEDEAAEDPNHQAMLPHQTSDRLSDPLAETAGQEREIPEARDPGSGVNTPGRRPVDGPTAPIEPDRSMHPRVQ